MDYSHLLNESVCVNFAGGREIVGILKGYDQVSNLVLDKVWEIFRDIDGQEASRRELGIIIVRGPNVISI